MLLMGIKEYAQSRSISEKLVRKLMLAGQIPFGKSGKKYLLVPEEQIKALFTAKEEVEKKKRATPNAFHAALKALVTT